MIRLGESQPMVFPGLETDDLLELKRDKTKPSWLPRGHVVMTVRPIQRRAQSHNRYYPTNCVVVVDPGHPYNIMLAGEILERRQPHSAKAHHAPMTLDSFALAVDHIGRSWEHYSDWLESDLGFAVKAKGQLRDWSGQPEFQRRLLDAQLKRRGERYHLSRTVDRVKTGVMFGTGINDSLDRPNPSAKVLQLQGAERALYRQMVNDNISKLANQTRRKVCHGTISHQTYYIMRTIECGDLRHATSMVTKLPLFGVNWLRHQTGVTSELISLVLGYELYYSVLYRELSAVGRRQLDPADLSAPPEQLDFSRVEAYNDWSSIILGRAEALLADYDGLSDQILRQRTKKIQNLIRYRGLESGVDGRCWVAPELAYQLPVL